LVTACSRAATPLDDPGEPGAEQLALRRQLALHVGHREVEGLPAALHAAQHRVDGLARRRLVVAPVAAELGRQPRALLRAGVERDAAVGVAVAADLGVAARLLGEPFQLRQRRLVGDGEPGLVRCSEHGRRHLLRKGGPRYAASGRAAGLSQALIMNSRWSTTLVAAAAVVADSPNDPSAMTRRHILAFSGEVDEHDVEQVQRQIVGRVQLEELDQLAVRAAQAHRHAARLEPEHVVAQHRLVGREPLLRRRPPQRGREDQLRLVGDEVQRHDRVLVEPDRPLGVAVPRDDLDLVVPCARAPRSGPGPAPRPQQPRRFPPGQAVRLRRASLNV
jgi:hypothetical protein